jgi:hypothetical protein
MGAGSETEGVDSAVGAGSDFVDDDDDDDEDARDLTCQPLCFFVLDSPVMAGEACDAAGAGDPPGLWDS